MKKDKGNSAKFSEGMGGVSTENNIDTAIGSPPPKGEGRAGAKAPERGVPPASSAPLSHGACVRRAAPGTCVNDCRGGPCGRPAAVTDVLRPRRGEYGNHTPYRRATARVAPTVKNARRCSVGAAHENPRGQGGFGAKTWNAALIFPPERGILYKDYYGPRSWEAQAFGECPKEGLSMKKTLRTTVSLLLTLCMALSLGGVSALAEGELPTISDPVAVSADSGTVTVTVGGSAATLPADATVPVTSGVVTITPAAGETPATVGIAANIATTGNDSDGVAAANSRVTVEGGVSTAGFISDGVYATNNSTVTVKGGVSTAGFISNGVKADNSTVTVEGGVSTEKDYSDGVYATNNSTVTVEGGVKTEGMVSNGVKADNSTVTVEGGVSTTGDNSYGVSVSNNSEVTVGGGVKTEGDNGEGVYATNKSTVEVTGSVSTEGIGSHGVDAVNNSEVTVKGDVSTKDFFSVGVYADENSTVKVMGGVKTEGNTSFGVYATNSSMVTVEGSVSTEKGNSHGIKATNSTVTVIKDADGKGGDVSTTKDKSHGVDATGNSTVTVEGKISTDGGGSHGVNAYDGTVTVTVGGGISTAGSESHGIKATNSTVTVKKDADGKGGNVSTTGERSHGVDATDSTVTVEGSVSTEKDKSRGVNENNSTVTVEGDVSTTGIASDGVYATNNSTVTVEGGVKTEGWVSNGVYAANSTVTVKKDADGKGGDVSTTDMGSNGVYATAGSKVTVEGGVKTEGMGSNGVAVDNNSTVTVEGGIKTEGMRSNGVFAAVNSTVTVEGDVTSEKSAGVQTSNNSTVEVGGDVTGGETGILVTINSDDAEGSTVVVEGTVSAKKEGGQAITLNVPDNATLDTVREALPEIIVQSIDSDADYVVCTGASPDNNAAIARAVQDSIKYIVDTESKKENGGTSTVTVDLVNYDTNEAADTYETADGKILAVATATTKLKLGVDQTKGALIGVAVTDANGAQTELEKNEKGDWVITVPAGGFKDGFKITATVKEKEPQPWFGPVWPSFGGETYTEVVQKRDPVRVEGKKLLIDLTETESVTLTAAALRGYRDSGVDTVEILVKNGSFVVEMGDLLNALGSAANVAFTSHGETLDISADGASLATLVLGAGA